MTPSFRSVLLRSLVAGGIVMGAVVSHAASDTTTQSEIRAALQHRHLARDGSPSVAPSKESGAEAARAAAIRAVIERRHPQTATAATPTQKPDAAASPAAAWAELLAGNRRFVSGTPQTRSMPRLRRTVADRKAAPVAVLGCSDSRVPPNVIFDRSLGDLFVVRTAGNVVDAVALGSLEYAVRELHPEVLLVLGHEHCGAVRAAIENTKMPSPFLAALIDRIYPAVAKIELHGSSAERLHEAVVANVYHSAANILDSSTIIKDAVNGGHIALVKAIYSLETGEVTTLP